eukprot:GHVN01004680.1.p1 GENE.GHVN01004680.1~~GHVN01004680.1.p1  ORF type:complete len:110 (-),score=54.85 GHVN01004680.1:156-485(-)
MSNVGEVSEISEMSGMSEMSEVREVSEGRGVSEVSEVSEVMEVRGGLRQVLQEIARAGRSAAIVIAKWLWPEQIRGEPGAHTTTTGGSRAHDPEFVTPLLYMDIEHDGV